MFVWHGANPDRVSGTRNIANAALGTGVTSRRICILPPLGHSLPVKNVPGACDNIRADDAHPLSRFSSMNNLIHPSGVLYAGSRPFPHLAACEHFAGSEKMLNKAIQIQAELSVEGRPVFDITADCEDGAHAGREREHAEMIAGLILSGANR